MKREKENERVRTRERERDSPSEAAFEAGLGVFSDWNAFSSSSCEILLSTMGKSVGNENRIFFIFIIAAQWVLDTLQERKLKINNVKLTIHSNFITAQVLSPLNDGIII